MNYSFKKIFISHAHEDRAIAGILKTCLESLGYQAFVAHDDITPSKQWMDEIINAMNECGVFVVIVSSYSNKSQWVNQEIGYAIAKNGFIVPIKIDMEDPKAMISTIQALRIQLSGQRGYNENEGIYDNCAKQVKLLVDSHRKSIPLSSTDRLINELISSSSFNESTNLINQLDKVTEFSEDQIDKLLDAALLNNQVRGAFVAEKFYGRLFSKNRQHPDKDKMSEVLRFFNE